MACLLKHEDIVGLLSFPEAIDAVRRGFAEQGAGQVRLPSRLTTDTGAGWIRMMPVSMEGSGFLGYKVMHLTQGVGVRYTVALYDLRSGELLAQMDAGWLTVVRTAVTTAIGTDYLARRDVKRLGILGSGEQARAHLQALRCVRRFEEVRVWSPSAERRQGFAAEFGAIAVDSAAEAVVGADVAVAAFKASSRPVVKAAWLRPGMHFNGISSVRPDAREIEDEVWKRSDVVVIDDRADVLVSGDGRSGLPEDAAELWELVSGRRTGRADEQQITLFKSVGTALQDVSLAAALYVRARERGIGIQMGEFPHVKG